MESTVNEAQYWMKKYGEQHKEAEGNFNKLKYHVEETMNLFRSDIERRVVVKDLECNFKTLNDLLFVKFKQLEDTKSAVRDLIAFTTYCYPIQL